MAHRSPEDAQASVRLGGDALGTDLELYRRWEESGRRSIERRANGRPAKRPGADPAVGIQLIAVAAVVALTAALSILAHGLVDELAPSDADPVLVAAAGGSGGAPGAGAADGGDRPRGGSGQRRPARKVPAPASLRDAWSYARNRGGLVSFAVVDTEGRLRGREESRGFVAASVVKAMLLVAEVRRLEREGAPLDPETEALLRSMITYSDNDAADAIYSRVGDPGLFAVARDAGMTGFTVAGHWGNAEITAADMARLFFEAERLLAGPHRREALGLLGSVIAEQSWGIPAVARPSWAVRFKGGWRSTDSGELVHQAAELRHRGRRLSIAVLTDGQPSHAFGVATVYGIAERLLSRPASRSAPAPRADAQPPRQAPRRSP